MWIKKRPRRIYRAYKNVGCLKPIIIHCVDKKGPYTKRNKLRRGLHGGLINSETYRNHKGWSEIKSY